MICHVCGALSALRDEEPATVPLDNIDAWVDVKRCRRCGDVTFNIQRLGGLAELDVACVGSIERPVAEFDSTVQLWQLI